MTTDLQAPLGKGTEAVDETQLADGVATAPHSRACGIHAHPHGARCSRDCPTCGGRDAAAPSTGWLDPPNPRHSCYDEMPKPTRHDWQRRWRCPCGKVYKVQDSQRDGFYFEQVTDGT